MMTPLRFIFVFGLLVVSGFSFAGEPVLRDGVVVRVRVETVRKGTTGDVGITYVREISDTYSGLFFTGTLDPFSVRFTRFTPVQIPATPLGYEGTYGAFTHAAFRLLQNNYEPEKGYYNLTTSGGVVFTSFHWHLGTGKVVSGNVWAGDFVMWFVKTGHCGWCGELLATGTHGEGVCETPLPAKCTDCGGDLSKCIHGEHECGTGDGGGDLDAAFPLVVNLVVTVILLLSVTIGVSLSGLFLSFFRDFLKSF
ncbi:MAG: hypothetical protein ACRC46_13345 [Thermoguttaceae bacterium]